MSLHRIVEFYSDHCVRCRTAGELFNLTDAAIREIGFDRWAMVHALWFRRPNKRLIRMDTFGEFADIFIERKYYRHDPALLACRRINNAFPWSHIRRLIAFGRQQQIIMREAHHHNLRMGLTMPVGVAGEPPGCMSFVTSKPQLPSRWHCRAAELIGGDAFREARRLHGFPGRARKVPDLSPRKLEILELAAQGKTDPEIAIILGIGEPTVRTHMTDLRHIFDVYCRTQLANAALQFGLVTFDDALPWDR